jgi:hypothetical protein
MKSRIRARRIVLVTALAAPALLLGAQAAQASWTLETMPTPSGLTAPYPVSVSCPNATDCIALAVGTGGTGEDGYTSFAEDWNGTSWTAASIVDPQDVILESVSCSSATACTAVGSQYESGTPVAERWNGTKWTVQTPPAPPDSAGLDSVSCPTATTCVAVGGETGDVPIAETWSAGTWTLSYPAPPSGTPESGLTSVSCMSAASCVALSSGPPEAITYSDSWNGTNWTGESVAEPIETESLSLSWVSCGSSSCQAVGYYTTPTTQDALAENWDGTGWTVETTPFLGGNKSADLGSVSCGSAGVCNAVGSETTTGGTGSTLLDEHWNGTNWSVHTILTPSGAQTAQLFAVSCASGTNCQAIGNYTTSAGTSLFAEQGS